MGTTAESVIIALEVQDGKLQVNAPKAAKTFDKAMSDIEKSAVRAERTANKTLGEIGKGLKPQQAVAVQQTISNVVSVLSNSAPALANVAAKGGEATRVLGALSGIAGVLGGAAAVATGLVAGLGIALLGAAVAGAKEAASERALQISAQGLGRAAGLTGDQLDRLATKAANAGGVSVRAAREMAMGYIETGRIGGEITGGLIRITEQFAKTMGVDGKTAAKALGAAFADPTKGAETLGEALGFLDDKTRQNIRTLQEQGDYLGAQRILYDQLKGSLLDAATTTTFLGQAWDFVKKNASDAATAIGKAVDKTAEYAARAGVLGVTGSIIVAQADAGRAAKPKLSAAQIKANQDSVAAGQLSENLFPTSRRRGELTAAKSTLERALQHPELLKDVSAVRATLKKTNADIAAIDAGFTNAAAQQSAGQRASAQAEQARLKALRQQDRARSEIKSAQDDELQSQIAITANLDQKYELEKKRLDAAEKALADDLALSVQQGELTQAQAARVAAARKLAAIANRAVLEEQHRRDAVDAAGRLQDFEASNYDRIGSAQALTPTANRRADRQAQLSANRREISSTGITLEREGIDSEEIERRLDLIRTRQAAELERATYDSMYSGVRSGLEAALDGNGLDFLKAGLREAALSGLAQGLTEALMQAASRKGLVGSTLSFLGFGRAAGGHVVGGQAYPVNEKGHLEGFVAPQSGRIVPLGNVKGGGGGGTVVLQTLQFNAQGAVMTESIIAQANSFAARAAQTAGQRALDAANRGAPGRLQRYQQLGS